MIRIHVCLERFTVTAAATVSQCLSTFFVWPVVQNHAIQVSQKPRFYGMTIGHDVGIYCLSSSQNKLVTEEWYKAAEYNAEQSKRIRISNGERIEIHKRNQFQVGHLIIKTLRLEDSGVYFCKINSTWGPGTELQVASKWLGHHVQYRSRKFGITCHKSSDG